MSDWDNRELCPDGACVGVITGGRCNVCGKAGSGKVAEAAAAAETDAETETETEADAATETATEAGSGDAWDTRKLCPDGACVGVIGASGRCGVCGKPAR